MGLNIRNTKTYGISVVKYHLIYVLYFLKLYVP
jgi:hypothetical protein